MAKYSKHAFNFMVCSMLSADLKTRSIAPITNKVMHESGKAEDSHPPQSQTDLNTHKHTYKHTHTLTDKDTHMLLLYISRVSCAL